MTEYKVSVSCLKKCSIEQADIAHRLKEIQQEIISISNNSVFSNRIYSDLLKNTHDLENDLKEQIDIIEKMQAALGNIAVRYLDTERKITEEQNKGGHNSIIFSNESPKSNKYKKILAQRKKIKTIMVDSNVVNAAINKHSYIDEMSENEKAILILLLRLRDKRKELKFTTKLKSVYSTSKAMSIVLKYSETIDKVSKELGVPK